MDIHVSGSRPTRRAPPEYFTGTVLQDPIIVTAAPARLASTRVSFEPGARTAWHTHPKGQTLYVTDGIGYVARRGGEPQEIRPWDVVYIEPGEEHWHGATPGRFMAHVAIQEADDQGEVVTWLEHVTEPRANHAGPIGAGQAVSGNLTPVFAWHR
jgi:quercetin dioxygenase-like cupin family protein